MLDHLGFAVRDVAVSRAFYEKSLAPLDFGIVMEVTPEMTGGDTYLGFGRPGRPQFWISTGGTPAGRVHVAFKAQNRAAVDAFHRAALAAGGTDNGAPGIRAHYHPDYYGAFVLDPDGHNIEAVSHGPE